MGGERRKEGKKEKKMPGIGNMPSLRKSKSRWALGVFYTGDLDAWVLDTGFVWYMYMYIHIHHPWSLGACPVFFIWGCMGRT